MRLLILVAALVFLQGCGGSTYYSEGVKDAEAGLPPRDFGGRLPYSEDEYRSGYRSVKISIKK